VFSNYGKVPRQTEHHFSHGFLKSSGKTQYAVIGFSSFSNLKFLLMDIVFSCPGCHQELVVDAQGAGSEIECPSCEKQLTVPQADAANVKLHGESQSAANRVEKPFVVPTYDKPAESLITKALPPLEAQKDKDKILRIKTIRHTDCKEVGHDGFDERVTEILNQIGETNIVSINTINYSYVDLSTKQLLSDFGVVIVYKG
jgi:uncharacterized protein YbaR (Trm112 family)